MVGSGCDDSSWKAVESNVTAGFHNPPRPFSYDTLVKEGLEATGFKPQLEFYRELDGMREVQ
jgi:hypothetical protein